VNDELGRIWNKEVVIELEILPRNLPEVTEKNHNEIRHGNRRKRLDLYRTSPKCMSEFLSLETTSFLTVETVLSCMQRNCINYTDHLVVIPVMGMHQLYSIFKLLFKDRT
jgi:hypothetical protein